MVAVVLATFSLDYYLFPRGKSGAEQAGAAVFIGVCVAALLTCWFVRKRRIAETTLREARDELQSRIEQRQAELARVSTDDDCRRNGRLDRP